MRVPFADMDYDYMHVGGCDGGWGGGLQQHILQPETHFQASDPTNPAGKSSDRPP